MILKTKERCKHKLMEILRKENKTQALLIALGIEDNNFTDTSQTTIIEQATSVKHYIIAEESK